MPAFSASLTDAVALRIDGSAALDVFGAVVGTANFSITQGTQNVDTHNSAIGAAGSAHRRLRDGGLAFEPESLRRNRRQPRPGSGDRSPDGRHRYDRRPGFSITAAA
jgi:hypothetical protein